MIYLLFEKLASVLKFAINFSILFWQIYKSNPRKHGEACLCKPEIEPVDNKHVYWFKVARVDA